MRLYLSGPISGKIDMNRPAFAEADKILTAKGHTIVNPHTVTDGMIDPTYAECMKADLLALLACEGIVLLKGWSKSKGVQLEHSVAATCGLMVYVYDRGELVER